MTADVADHLLPEHSIDAFLGGQVTLVQPLKGHRAGLDAALLQAVVPADASGHAVDLGSGVGTVAFCVAARALGLTVAGVEREADLVACARAALQHPGNRSFADHVRFVEADVTVRREAREAVGLADGCADWVLMNPPFDLEGKVRASPDSGRRGAHVAAADTIGSWCRAAAGLLLPGGRLGLIHRAPALADVLRALAGRFGDVRIVPVQPRADAPATRVLVRATKGSRGGLQIAPPLVLHEADGAWTQPADAILRGRAGMSSMTEDNR